MVKYNGTQTDTVWSIENYLGRAELQVITSNDIFEISGNQRPLSESHNYGNRLKIHDCSSIELNGTILYCGSHVNPKQALFYLKVCGMLFEL